ncbi:MAG: PEGA domain-containing protein [Spirochaetaceae bacterium]|nr:MAG: PEGA domain-containing protein [Spirochaetaceae bacterium]
MAKKRPQPRVDPESVHVRLGPLFGLAPRTWLPAACGAIVLLLLFILLLLPGIRRPGALVEMYSTPSGASVYVDGRRVGATPLTMQLPAGRRSIEYRRAQFETARTELTVPNRLFGSRFFPARLTLHQRLQLDDPRALVDAVASEYAGWAIIGSASAQYQFPWTLSHGVSDLAADSDALAGYGRPLLQAALSDVRSDAMLRDYLRASALAASGGNAALPVHMLDLFTTVTHLVETRPNLGTLFAAALSGELRDEYQASEWYTEGLARQTTRLLPHTTEGGPDVQSNGIITVGGSTFRHLSGGGFVMGMPADGDDRAGVEALYRPHLAEVSEFYIQQTPVTRAAYRDFLSDNPYWREDNRETLIEDGVATPDYLRSWGYRTAESDDDLLPASEVSYFAAVAYCQWFGTQLPAALDGWTVRLPYEAEYEWAVLANASEGYDSGFRRTSDQSEPYAVAQFDAGQFAIYDLLGNVWHWTAAWYRPADYLTREHPYSPYTQSRPPAAAEKAVRGGSWVNSARTISAITRGAQPPHWASPFLGFRPVISQES